MGKAKACAKIGCECYDCPFSTRSKAGCGCVFEPRLYCRGKDDGPVRDCEAIRGDGNFRIRLKANVCRHQAQEIAKHMADKMQEHELPSAVWDECPECGWTIKVEADL